jgi:hypothetical protein
LETIIWFVWPFTWKHLPQHKNTEVGCFLNWQVYTPPPPSPLPEIKMDNFLKPSVAFLKL